MQVDVSNGNVFVFNTVNDEQSAMFAEQMGTVRVLDLDGVSIMIGNHPVVGLSVIVAPASGKHAILSNPFEFLALSL